MDIYIVFSHELGAEDGYWDGEPGQSLEEVIAEAAGSEHAQLTPFAWMFGSEPTEDNCDEIAAESIAAGRLIDYIDGKYVPRGFDAPRPHFAAAIEQMQEPNPFTELLDDMERSEAQAAEPTPDLVQKVRELAAIQLSACDCVNDPYFRGLYNGLELALAVLEDREPVYVEKPEAAQPKAPAFAALSLDGPSAFRAPVAVVRG